MDCFWIIYDKWYQDFKFFKIEVVTSVLIFIFYFCNGSYKIIYDFSVIFFILPLFEIVTFIKKTELIKLFIILVFFITTSKK